MCSRRGLAFSPDFGGGTQLRAELKASLRGRYDAVLQAALGPPEAEAIRPARIAEEATPPPWLRSGLEKAALRGVSSARGPSQRVAGD